MKKYLLFLLIFILAACSKKPTEINVEKQNIKVDDIIYEKQEEDVVEDEIDIEDENVETTDIKQEKAVNFDPIVKNVVETALPAKSDAFFDDLDTFSQFPELPKGSEVTALAMALKYMGYDVDKVDLSDNYLNKSETNYNISPYECFIGNPKNSYDFGCFSDVLVNCATNFGANVINLTGSEFDNLFVYIEKGYPVVFFASNELLPYTDSTLKYKDREGNEQFWKNENCCFVLVGFNYTRDVVALADTTHGVLMEYSLSTARTRYNENNKQALIVY